MQISLSSVLAKNGNILTDAHNLDTELYSGRDIVREPSSWVGSSAVLWKTAESAERTCGELGSCSLLSGSSTGHCRDRLLGWMWTCGLPSLALSLHSSTQHHRAVHFLLSVFMFCFKNNKTSLNIQDTFFLSEAPQQSF